MNTAQQRRPASANIFYTTRHNGGAQTMTHMITVTFQAGLDGRDASAMAGALRQHILNFRLDLAVLAVMREEAGTIANSQAGLDDWRITGLEVLSCEEVMP
jgi:hypothetical protein